MLRFSLALMVLSAALLLSCGDDAVIDPPENVPEPGQWELRGTGGLLIGGYGDNFVYGGGDVKPVPGYMSIDVNADVDTGSVLVVFEGSITPESGVEYQGEIRFVAQRFDSVYMQWAPWQEGGVADDIVMHGPSGNGPPIMPQVRGFLAAWSQMTSVYVDNVMMYDSLDTHFMYTDGARDNVTHMIYQSDRVTPYNPMMPGNSYVDPDDRELHIVVHTRIDDPTNFPPFTVWIHLNFETVEIIKAPKRAPQ